jgi:energy-coupling factor transporter transmembrane protein EcfT
MKQGRTILILVGLLLVIILAFFLQDVIRQTVVTPLAYIWWVLKFAYTRIPQVVFWIILLAFLVLIILTNLLKWYPAGPKYDEKSRPIQGPVETLTGWLRNSLEGNYYKWMVANRLAKLWQEMSGGLEDRNLQKKPGAKAAMVQLPPEAVQRYLKAGLDKTFVDYPLPPLPFMRREATPFDIKVDEAVEFLESQMEASSGKKHE